MKSTITFNEIGTFSSGRKCNLGIFDVLEITEENKRHESITIGIYDKNTKDIEVSKFSFYDKEMLLDGYVIPTEKAEASYHLGFDDESNTIELVISMVKDGHENKINDEDGWSLYIRIPLDNFNLPNANPSEYDIGDIDF